MKLNKIAMSALLAISFIAPLHSSTSASAESTDVLAKGALVRPGSSGAYVETYCPPGMAVVGVSASPIIPYYSATIRNFQMQCLGTPMPSEGTRYSQFTRILMDQRNKDDSVRDAYCPVGSVLLGVRATESEQSFIGDVGLICGSPDTGKVLFDSNIGIAARKVLNSTSLCPAVNGKPTYVIGMESYGATWVTGLRVLCGRTLKSGSKLVLPENDLELLATYVPSGKISADGLLYPNSVNPYVNFGPLSQVGSENLVNTDVFPFRTSTTTSADPNHFLQFTVTPTSPNVLIKIRRITYSSLSYAPGTTPYGTKVTGGSANVFQVSMSSTPTWSYVSLTPAWGGVNLNFPSTAFAVFPTIKDATTVKISFVGGTGIQYNDLSGRDGASGMRIYGQLIDNSPVVEDSPSPTPKPTSTPKVTPKATPSTTSKATPKATTKVTTKPTPKATTAKKVNCSKAGTTRKFTGSKCPPGWIKK